MHQIEQRSLFHGESSVPLHPIAEQRRQITIQPVSLRCSQENARSLRARTPLCVRNGQHRPRLRQAAHSIGALCQLRLGNQRHGALQGPPSVPPAWQIPAAWHSPVSSWPSPELPGPGGVDLALVAVIIGVHGAPAQGHGGKEVAVLHKLPYGHGAHLVGLPVDGDLRLCAPRLKNVHADSGQNQQADQPQDRISFFHRCFLLNTILYIRRPNRNGTALQVNYVFTSEYRDSCQKLFSFSRKTRRIRGIASNPSGHFHYSLDPVKEDPLTAVNTPRPPFPAGRGTSLLGTAGAPPECRSPGNWPRCYPAPR